MSHPRNDVSILLFALKSTKCSHSELPPKMSDLLIINVYFYFIRVGSDRKNLELIHSKTTIMISTVLKIKIVFQHR